MRGDEPAPEILTLVGDHFDKVFYRREYPDVGDIDPVLHYCSVGWREGRNPGPFFDTVAYLAAHGDVSRSGMNPYFHWLNHGRFENRLVQPAVSTGARTFLLTGEEVTNWVERLAPVVDPTFYGEQLGSTMVPGLDPVAHFAFRGWREGRPPRADHPLKRYVDDYPEAVGLLVNPVLAAVLAEAGLYRRQQGKPRLAEAPPETECPPPEPSVDTGVSDHVTEVVGAAFDHEYYLAHYPDVRDAGVDPLRHFLDAGWREGRNPSRSFETEYYLRANPDVAAAGINPFWHYLVAGRFEERRPIRPGGWRRSVLDAAIEPARKTEGWKKPPLSRISASEVIRRLRLDGPAAGLAVAVSHDCYARVVGGTQIFLHDEQRAFNARGWRYVHLAPFVPRLALAEPDAGAEVQVTLDGKLLGRTNFARLRQRFASEGVTADLLAVHSLLGLAPEEVLDLRHVLAPARSLLWLHDFSTLCESITLLRNDIAYCGAPPPDSMACRICVYGPTRRRHLDRVSALLAGDGWEIVAPSEAAASIWREGNGLPVQPVTVHPHWRLKPERKRKRPNGGPLRVAFLGFPAASKGWPIFEDIVSRFAADRRYAFFQFVTPGAPALPGVQQVETRVDPADRFAARRLLGEHEIDVVMVLTICPETFSFVAHEAIAAGALVVCLEQGGNVPAMVRGTGRGLTVAEPEIPALFEDGTLFQAVIDQGRVPHAILKSGTSATLVPGLAREAAE